MLPELRASERFGHVVSFHLVGWAVLYYHIAFADLVGDKEIPIVDGDVEPPSSLIRLPRIFTRARRATNVFYRMFDGRKAAKVPEDGRFCSYEGTSNILIGQWLYTCDETLSGKQCIFLGVGTILP